MRKTAKDKKVTKEAATIAMKTAQKETAAVFKKKRINFAQLVNAASCSIEPDIFVELQQEDWYCFICEEKSVQGMIQCTA
jgi:hypothetical protein